MSLVANGSVLAAPLLLPPEWIDGDELCRLAVGTGITFSLRGLSTLAVEELEEEAEEDDADDDAFAAGAIEIFDRTPSPLVPLTSLGLLWPFGTLLLPLLLLMIACALSASFSWHIIFNRRLMGVDSGPKKSEMVLERVFRNASFRFRADLYGGLRCCPLFPVATAKADGADG